MLLFKPEHVPMILDGRKTQTRRLWKRRRAVPGSTHQASTKMFDPWAVFAKLNVIKVYQERLGSISYRDARAEGYEDCGEYITVFANINGLSPHDARVRDKVVWVVEFRLATISTGHGKRTQKQRVHDYRANDYPDNWAEIARDVKQRAGNRCVRCGAANDPAAGYMLTVAHLIPDKSNVEDWNLVALCQRCHLHLQHKIDFEQPYMFEHSAWLQWRWEAYLEWRTKLSA